MTDALNPEDLNAAVESMETSPLMQNYLDRHGIEAASYLTVINEEIASLITDHLEPRIAGKTVVEIGGGLGFLSLHMGFVAKKVFCIEANPVWATSFIAALLAVKPKNVSYLFGAAEEFEGHIRGDVAVICTHSGLESMTGVAHRLAPTVIDVYGEIIAANPKKFDRLAQTLRGMT